MQGIAIDIAKDIDIDKFMCIMIQSKKRGSQKSLQVNILGSVLYLPPHFGGKYDKDAEQMKNYLNAMVRFSQHLFKNMRDELE